MPQRHSHQGHGRGVAHRLVVDRGVGGQEHRCFQEKILLDFQPIVAAEHGTALVLSFAYQIVGLDHLAQKAAFHSGAPGPATLPESAEEPAVGDVRRRADLVGRQGLHVPGGHVGIEIGIFAVTGVHHPTRIGLGQTEQNQADRGRFADRRPARRPRPTAGTGRP